MNQEYIVIEGARQNNLKGLNLKLPLKKLIVITGVSGSGKSSLAFDTIYAEGQRRYIETFSSYARQFLDRMDKPKVDKIEGIPPAIAIDQTSTIRTSRSTVGTMTELNDHIKLLFARASYLTCQKCGHRVNPDSADLICDQMTDSFNNKTTLISFRVSIPPNFKADEILGFLSSQGYTRILAQDSSGIDVIQDRVLISAENRDRIMEDLEAALKHGNGKVTIFESGTDSYKLLKSYSNTLHCADCDIQYKEATAGLFSFNSPVGACATCRGFGREIGVDYNRVIPDWNKTLRGGAVKPWQTMSFRECQDDLLSFSKKNKVPVDIPWKELSEEQRNWVLKGDGSYDEGKWYGIEGFFKWLETKSYKMHIRVLLSRYRAYHLCSACNGARLKPEALNWKIGNDGLSINDVMQLPVDKTYSFFKELLKKETLDDAAKMVLDEISVRLKYLLDVGLGYLTLDRQSRTLSGGEVQRINLTTALGTSLVNTLFVLDEPSIGLHSRDINRLIGVLHNLRDVGNTIIVVEHDPEVIQAADYVIDMGPGPGELGGDIVFFGLLNELFLSKTSKTSPFINKTKKVETIQRAVSRTDNYLHIRGAAEHNLKDIDVSIPLKHLVCITGVSGSGKSTLIQDICYNGIKYLKGKPVDTPGKYMSIEGYDNFSDVIMVDQSPIGKTTRANPASYVGAFDIIRARFADEPLAKSRGYTAGTFSFNSGTGRCPACGGNGFEHVEMQFLSDIYIRCPDCDGKRFRSEILEVKLNLYNTVTGLTKKTSISDILDLTVQEMLECFKYHPQLVWRLGALRDVGLSYLRLGQPLTTLSGGEAQRLKLAGFLADNKTEYGKCNLFLLDEPTTGLHFEDIQVLLNSFKILTDAGHTVVVIEHNLDVINSSDWIIDLGPEGGMQGGDLIFAGTPHDIVMCQKSHTGKALKNYLNSAAEKYTPPAPDHLAVKDFESSYNQEIVIRNAREHNLKNVNITIPRNKFTLITGVSGSGKSTIAFDILFAEGQRRYLESLNAYARQFIQPASRPDVDAVLGIPPSVAIEQRTSRGGRKSTVATVTEIYHFLRLLFVKLGIQYCPDCNIPITPQSQESILDEILKSYTDEKLSIFAPLVINRKGYYTDLAKWAAQKEFPVLRVDGLDVSTDAWPRLDRFKEHTIELPIGMVKVSPDTEIDLRSKIDLALLHGKGTLYVEAKKRGKLLQRTFSTLRSCPQCQRSFDELDPRSFSFNTKHGWCPDCYGTGLEMTGFDAEQTGEEIIWNEWFDGTEHVCSSCTGKRLKKEVLSVFLNGRSISQYAAFSITEARLFFEALKLKGREALIANDIIWELLSRLSFLEQVGLEYLTLDRAAPTLSGGEAQRIRLAAQLGSNLKGVCYILDEPTIGLHPRDNAKLLDTLFQLKDKGNTVVVVEHDEDTIRRAEHVIDLGPGGGKSGGHLIFQGKYKDILKNKESVTAHYLRQPLAHARKRRKIEDLSFIEISGANLHNLKNIDIKIPLGRFVTVSGVSGSGKSTLVRDILFSNLKSRLSDEKGKRPYYGCKSIAGWENISRILEVDQSPIGKTPRSCPATYIGFMDDIRKIYAKTSESMIRGYTASRFSFNTNQGRCPECEGQGMKKIEMSFLPDVSIPCEVCGGMRFTPETLAVKFKDKTVADVLNMNIDEAVEFFAFHHGIYTNLKLLQETGLGYLSLGQQSPTLSGGEAQRIKLVTELGKTNPPDNPRKRTANPHTMYVLDEPTVGLHMADVDKLIGVLHRLVDAGNSVIIIEHNLDIIAESDWVIDLGPEGGDGGGSIITQGTPEKIIKDAKKSYTAKFLKEMFEAHGKG